MVAVTRTLQEEAFEVSKPDCVSAYQASACITFAKASLAESSHMIKISFNMGKDLLKGRIPGGVIHWEATCNSLTHQ